jgi:hypothetical protein
VKDVKFYFLKHLLLRKLLLAKNRIMEQVDRFISQRTDEDASIAFNTKVQLFSSPPKRDKSNSASDEDSDRGGTTVEETDSTRTYQALLQN